MMGGASGPGLPKKEGGEGLVSENRAPGTCVFFFLCVSTCVQHAFSGPLEMLIG